jgi:hypothetical protein
MSNFSRRAFLKGVSAASSLPLLGSTAFAKANLGKADTIVKGGTFHTMDPSLGSVEAIAIRGERIIAGGSIDDVSALATPNTKVIDATGMTVTPGFIDAHSHPMGANEALSVNVGYRTITEVQAALRKKAAETPKGHWISGIMYDDTKFKEGRPVNKADLDAVSTDHPIFIRHRGGHTGVVNTKGFEVAGVTLDTPDPSGGKFYRDANGFTGKVAEKANYAFQNAGVWPVATRASHQENCRLSTLRMASNGLTSTTDAGGSLQSWTAYQDAYRSGELNCRVTTMPRKELYEIFKSASIRTGFGDDMLNVGAVKYGADGSASERTMAMSTPYAGKPNDYGIQTMNQEEIYAAVDDAIASGYRIGIHANGDVTIDMVLNAYERVLKDWKGPNPRLRIEHCSLVNDNLLRRIKATGSIPTPFYTYAHYHGEKWHEYGAEKMKMMFAHKSFFDYGIPVAPASDFAPGPYEPMMALQSMITRKDPQGNVWGANQRITFMQAMQVVTMNGAFANFDEDKKGSLTPGKLADICILANDPGKHDPDDIKNIKIVRTILGGRTIFEA